MKDAKGHGSNPRGAAHQVGVQQATEAGAIKSLVDGAKARGVDLSLEPFNSSQWQLAWMDRGVSPRGSGAAVLNDIHAAADKMGKSVMLQPIGGAKRLEKYYRGFGYKRAGYGDENGPVMVRKAGTK